MTPTKDTTIIAARVPTSMLTPVDKYCHHFHITRSIFLRKALSWYIKFGHARIK